MSIRKLPSGRWHARLKSGRQYVVGRTFDTRRDAQAWLARERAALAGGVDPRAGRTTVRKVLPTWLEMRKVTVTPKTYVADTALPRLLPNSMAALQIGAVTDRDVARVLVTLTRQGLAESSVRRFRASLSAFFAWAVRERMIGANPVSGTRVPTVGMPPVEMHPFGEDELEEFWEAVRQRNERLANILLVAGWTGLRWSELRALRVRDFVEVPMPLLIVERAEPEGVQVKVTKSGRGRRVPVADRVLSIVQELARGKTGDQLLFVTESGHQLHASAVKRTVSWASLARGRRIHDLRHTAACLWLARGVDLATVQAWMGHASIATTNIYLHHLGTGADQAGLDRLNRRGTTNRGNTGGTRSGEDQA
jgi:integrase